MKYAVIVCAGASSRFGREKLTASLFGRPLITKSIEIFGELADEILLVVSDDNKAEIQKAVENYLEVSEYSTVKIAYCLGGETRAQSVKNALDFLQAEREKEGNPKTNKGQKTDNKESDEILVAIHDGARPFVSKELVEKLFSCAEKNGCAIPCLSPTDSLCEIDGKPICRDNVRQLQTPQVFRLNMIYSAYCEFENCQSRIDKKPNGKKGGHTKAYITPTDDSALYYAKYGELTFVEGERGNLKITYPCDLPRYKMGYGYDIHTFAPNRKLFLGGVEIEFPKGLDGHSDADAPLHALMDALLSAAGLPDIGHFFPTNEPAYNNIDSKILLKKVKDVLTENHLQTVNVSLAIVAEAPKIAPYVDKMRKVISQILEISPADVGITATTAEGVGEIGKGEAISARCSVLIRAV